MCDKKEEDDIPQDGSLQDLQSYLFQQEQAVQNRQQPMQLDQGSHGYYVGGGVGDHERGAGLQFQEPTAPPILPWPLPPPIHSSFNSVHLLSNLAGDRDGHFFAPPSSSYGHGTALFGRRPSGLQLAYEAAAADHLGLGGLYISEHLGVAGRASSSPLTFQSELSRMTAQEIMDAKALAASKSHSEAERRRRERINNHLARLRSLLPSTSKVS